ncbi:uncharacterized protein MONOS_727 [Monocercomonoides exilis]|uniref:uncharacterized protein n=1 Tax=Monocercomonoides exilis TaxID=2049356 RepID=UPI00355A4F97|nr:hypothetical protein MONOS_727 [Monocercomonoides exilis]|eukprot:MONOS_727.1-p1 / transcript=MONOS_727.1 / gene=MONOS_727 / organism=Monocercomonoides_exilis_PA203 / gene_product=unspecified product / transcript_product=unspecified product / location=Mono_scaffold00012:116721-119159(+) / protein_length=813 / sequence_SO=supercontig / SO=protein_coding / is_pseudo=false
MFKNQADKGLDIFFRCPSFTNAEESKKFGINFQHSFWVEQNSIAAESIEDGKIVDYLEFITYRNTEIFVSGLEDSTKKCQNKHISSSSLPSSSLSPDDFSMYAKGRVVNQAVGWDIFYCGKEDSPCHTVNYAITHLISVPFTTKQIEQHKSLHLLSFAPNLRASREENDGKQFTLHIIGMPAVYNFVTWNSLLVDGDTDDACLLLESSKQEASEKETIKQLDETRKDCDKINFHVTIKGMCMLCNTKVKIGSDLPVNCLFFINDESNFSVENCHISSVNEWATMPTVFKIQTGTLLCSLMSIDKVLFGSYSFFIDCSELDDESKVNVRLNLCILSNITVPERNSLIAFSIKGQNISANNENQHIFESSSFSLSKSSSNLNQIPQANSSSSLSPNTSQSAADSSTPLHIPLQFISTNISLSSQMPGNSLFLTANGRSCVEIRGCNFLFMNAPSSAEEAQERTEYAVCQWNCSFISFCDCTAYVRNTTFRTRLAGAIYAENSYLLIDVASLKENSAGLTEFPSVAHNIICHRKGSKKEGKGVIELVSSDGSSANSEFDVQRGENRQLNHYGQHEVKSDEEMPDNFWIESNDCSLLGFPGAVISSLFTPLPENVSKVRNGEGFVVTITGKYLLNCYLAMVLLINQTNGGKATKELIEISSSTELTSNHEKAISAYFPKDAVEQRSGANVYVALKFSDEHALKADAMTIPLCLTEGKEPEKIDLIATIVSVVATAAIVCVGIAILLILLRRKRKKKMTSAERREKQSLLSSINSEFICVTTKRADNKTLTYTIYDYGTTTKSIDIPSDMQDPFFED